MDQERLFRLAVEAATVTVRFTPGQGWTLTRSRRRGDETWAQATQETFSLLTTAECVDVLAVTSSWLVGDA